MTTEEEIIKCPICKAVIEDVYLFPDLIARFYKWTVSNRNGISHKSWYCSKHSIEEIRGFEEKTIKIK